MKKVIMNKVRIISYVNIGLIVVSVMITGLFFARTTTFPMPSLVHILQLIKASSFLLILSKFILTYKEQWKQYFFATLLSLLFFCIYRANKEEDLIWGAILIFTSIGIDYRKILKTHLTILLFLFLVTIVMACTGTIQDLVYANAKVVRSSFGICYPTDFASYLFFFLLLSWVAWNKLPNLLALILCILVTVFVNIYPISDTCTICGCTFFIVLIGASIARHSVNRGVLANISNKFVCLGCIVAFPLMAAMTFFMVFLYAQNSGMGIRLNSWLSGRLALTLKAFQENGIHLFGREISQIGWGYSTLQAVGYNFVDSTYPLLLIKYGSLCFIVICIFWMRTAFLAVKAKDYRLALAVALIAVHSVSEHHFVEFNYNILLYLPFAIWGNKLETYEVTEKKQESFAIIAKTILLSCFLILLSSFWWLPRMRTICGWMRRTNNQSEVIFFIITLLLLFTSVILGCLVVFEMIHGKSKRNIIFYFVSAVATLIFLVSYWGSLEKKAYVEFAPLIDEEHLFLEQELGNAKGDVYVMEIPNVYTQYYHWIKNGILEGEELSRKNGITVVAPRNREYSAFIKRGFLFFPYSSKSAIYTNDIYLIKDLEAKGYALKGYYDQKIMVDLTDNAHSNELRSGRYMFGFKFTYENSELERVARISISNKGESALLHKEDIVKVNKESKGNIDYSFRFYLRRDVREMATRLYALNSTIKVLEAYFCKEPRFDIHRTYDERRNLIAEEYYLTDGSRTLCNDLYFKKSMSYDKNDRLKECIFYDINETIAPQLGGYSKIRYSYDSNGKQTKIEYLNGENDRVVIAGGFSYEELVYDSSGMYVNSRYYDEYGRFLYSRVPKACHGWE